MSNLELASISKRYYLKLRNTIDNINFLAVDHACSLIEQAWKSEKQIITLGNGGSSLTALHLINDWNKSIYLATRKPFRGRTLVDNVGLLMSYANDISFEDVFTEQLKNIMMPGDLVIAISGSGNSENVVRAVNFANANGAITLGLTGYDGGKVNKLVQHSLLIQVEDMQIAEDVHMTFGHIVMKKLCGYKI